MKEKKIGRILKNIFIILSILFILGCSIFYGYRFIIMTSNIGSRQLKDFGQGVGFGTQAKKDGKEEYSRSVIDNALKRSFAPEFLNRIDDVVIFNSLERADIHKIIARNPRDSYRQVL